MLLFLVLEGVHGFGVLVIGRSLYLKVHRGGSAREFLPFVYPYIFSSPLTDILYSIQYSVYTNIPLLHVLSTIIHPIYRLAHIYLSLFAPLSIYLQPGPHPSSLFNRP